MLNIVIFGAPGSGKGTQSERIVAKYGINHISTGDVLRAEIKNGTELGKTAKGYIDQGQLLPDELIIDILASTLDSFKDELMKRLIKRGQESGRADDNEETIKKRLTVYHSQTAPLIDWYKNEKLYAHIKGIGELETITADVCKAIDAAK